MIAIAGIRIHRRNPHHLTILHCPYHAIEIAQLVIKQMQLPLTGAQWIIEPATEKPWEHYRQLLLDRGEVQEWVLDGFLMPYQIDAIVKTGHRIGTHLWHPTGSGKTLTGIIWCLLAPRSPIIVVTRAAARIQYGREITKYTHLRPHIIRPASAKKSQTLDEYFAWCAEHDQRPIVIVGWESLTYHIEALERLAQFGASVIYDESHRGKSPKRWQAVPLPEPSEKDDPISFYAEQKREAKRKKGFIPKVGEEGKYGGTDLGRVMIVPRENITSAASSLAKAASRVINTTATPIKDRVRDLWAQLDLAEPYSWGSANKWMFRYAAAHEGKYGGLDTSGSSNQEELAMRLESVVHRISYEETHRHLPPKRRQSVYIAPEDQCRATAGFAKELREASKRGASRVLEVRIAQAASKKRRAVLGMIEDHIGSGHKIVVFTGRRRDAEKIGKDVERMKVVKTRGTPIWYAHGGVSERVRDKMKLAYGAHDGACVLVATGQSFGESLDGLQCTDAAMFVALPYTPGDLLQWEGRFARNGQMKPVTIYYIIAEQTIDEHIADIIISKLDAVKNVAKNNELSKAEDILAGIDDEDAIMASIMAKLND
jgi:superfamily II DNA or RNA helicase